jgi:hypothetical protein
MSSACAPSDPNFPQDLAISPLETPPALASDADGPTYSFSPDVVSAADQARAIHQYGIAGRVWCVIFHLLGLTFVAERGMKGGFVCADRLRSC